ncbi:MAG TPA: hypothetical protein ENK35_11220 [Candidatus Tenderia sp.]|nr:hypothetical protein [Candidatus Tenderia sp.]
MLVVSLIALALVAIFIAAWRVPPVALGAILSMYGIEQFAQSVSPFYVQHATLINIFIGVTALVAFYRRHRKSHFQRLSYGDVGVVTVTLYLYALISTLWSPIPNESLAYYLASAPYVILYVFVAPLLVAKTKDLEESFEALVYIGMAASVMLLFFAEWEGRGVVVAGNEGGEWASSNPLASSEMAGYVALAAFFMPRGDKGKWWDYFRWGAVVLSLMLAVRSGSRGQTIFMLLSLALFYPLRQRFDVKAFVSMIVGAVFVGLVMVYSLDAYWGDTEYNRWESDAIDEAVAGRTEMAGDLMASWWQGGAAAFVFGLGNSASFDPDVAGYYPHIVPVEILGEEGLLGFIIYVAMLVMTWRAFLKIMGMKSDRHRQIAVALGAMFFFSFLLSMKQGSLLGATSVALFATLIGKWRYITATSIRYHRKRANLSGSSR